MPDNKQLDETIKLTSSLKGLAQAYEEISVTKMQRVRDNVLASRDYLTALSEVFNTVKQSYHADIQALIAKKHGHGVVSFSTGKNGKSILILLSSDSKLHGDIGRKVFRYFLEKVKAGNSDIYIIGTVGKELFDAADTKREYSFMKFPETKDEQENLAQLYEVLELYEEVTVFYGQFVNVLTQNANTTSVTGYTPADLDEKVEKVHFFFEPSLKSVLQFFESQIFTSLFRQTLHESQLAHDASRINQMESALSNIQDSQFKLIREKRRIHKRQENQKQIQRMLGRRLWR